MTTRIQTALLLTALTLPVLAQQSAPQPNDVEVRLESKDGLTQFTLGEPIKLELVFIAHSGATGFSVNNEDYGDISEDIHVTPSEGTFLISTASSHDYGSEAPLSDKPIRISVLLNQGLIFQKPGSYQVSLTTSRLFRKTPEGFPGPRTTNTVTLNITAPDTEKESALVRSLSGQIASLTGDARNAAARQLAWLTGDEAVRAKVHWLLADEDEILAEGLAASANLQLQLDLLEAAWRDPHRTPDSTLQEALATTRNAMRRRTRPGFQMWGPAEPADAVKPILDERQHDLDEIAATLPLRSGDNRTHTAYFLSEFGSVNTPAVHTAIIEEFRHMAPLEQSMLLETRWPQTRDPALAPALKNILAANSDNRDVLQRLIELDPEAAKPFVIHELCDPKSSIMLEQVATLPSDTLPETSNCLLDQLQQRLPALVANPNRPDLQFQWKAELAARFATAEILPAMRDLFAAANAAASRTIITPRPADAVLAYLLRYAPEEAVPVIQQSVHPSLYPSLNLYEIHHIYTLSQRKFPPELVDWFRSLVQQGTDIDAAGASYELSISGIPEDKAVLLARLEKLHHNWAAHSDQLAAAKPSNDKDPLSEAARLETDLVSNLIYADKVWTSTPSERSAIIQTCISPDCKRLTH